MDHTGALGHIFQAVSKLHAALTDKETQKVKLKLQKCFLFVCEILSNPSTESSGQIFVEWIKKKMQH